MFSVRKFVFSEIKFESLKSMVLFLCTTHFLLTWFLHKKHIFLQPKKFHRVIYCSLILQWFKNDGNVMAAVSNLDDYDCKMWVIESDPYTRLFLKLPYIWFALYPFNPRSLYFSHRFSFLFVQIVERKVSIMYFVSFTRMNNSFHGKIYIDLKDSN